jgi:hypothetical protein
VLRIEAHFGKVAARLKRLPFRLLCIPSNVDNLTARDVEQGRGYAILLSSVFVAAQGAAATRPGSRFLGENGILLER